MTQDIANEDYELGRRRRGRCVKILTGESKVFKRTGWLESTMLVTTVPG